MWILLLILQLLQLFPAASNDNLVEYFPENQLDAESLKQLDFGMRKVFGFTDEELISRRTRNTNAATTVVPQFMVDLANHDVTRHHTTNEDNDFTFSGNIRAFHPKSMG